MAPRMKMGVQHHKVASAATGDRVAQDGAGGRKAVSAGKGVVLNKSTYKSMYPLNKVPSGKGSAFSNRSPVANGSVAKGQSQRRGTTGTSGGVGKPAKGVVGPDQGPPQGVTGKGAPKGSGSNRFDLYAAARK